MMYPFGIIFFLLCVHMHACNARHLGFGSEEIDNYADFLAKDVNKLKFRDQLETRPSISKEEQTQELQEDGVQGRRIQESLIGATMKQTLFNSLLKAKEGVAKLAISSGYFQKTSFSLEHAGYDIIISSGADLHGMEEVEGLKKITRSRSMLGNEENVDFKEKDNVDDDMDYSQPHRKPPIHNEKN